RSGLALQTRTLPAVPAAPPMREVATAARPLLVMTSPAPARVQPPVLPVPLPVQAEPETAPRLPEAALLAVALPAEPAAPALLADAGPLASAMVAAVAEVPVYRTRIPPAATLHYVMRYGPLSGNGELVWRHTANGYEASLQGRVVGINILSWSSEGAFDGAGLAPVRYTDQRRGKAVQAANFQRKAGKITYSGPSVEFPLVPGAQDRLSWMIQIAAIASADPKLLGPGGRVAMYVSGTRDAEVWAFQVQGTEDVVTDNATLHAIKLLREPRQAHDTRVEVWLDPAQHFLPVRARLSNDNSALELMLSTLQPTS
ncbi:MAG TPA: DUF3108 domain-containing protein, partial [Rhizobacter sp.]|nr:DUF3108 domain-containing protein [Rhizobacter sp.]